MREIWNKNLGPLLMTLGLILLSELFSSTILPGVGLYQYRVPFNILVILFMGFRLETPLVGIFILVVQYFHGFFSVEGWEMGVVAGILISLLISYLKELLQFHSKAATFFMIQIFQMIWFVLTSCLIYLKSGDMEYILAKLWRFFPESLFISLMTPPTFILLDFIWKQTKERKLGESHYVR